MWRLQELAACALGHKACRKDLSLLHFRYFRMPGLFAARLSPAVTGVRQAPAPDRTSTWGPEP